MERNRFWIFLGILACFGLAMEFLKDSTPPSAKLKLAPRFEDIEGAGMVAGADARAGRIQGVATPTANEARVGGFVPSIPTSAEKTQAPAAAKVADKTKKDAKKKDDKKKKKKKKKKKEDSPADPSAEGQSETDESDEDESEDTTAAAATTSGAVAIAPAAPATNSEIPRTQSDWENLLLRDPDFKATEKLVRFYQSGMVNAEVFYNLIRMMLEDSRPKMRQLGLVALGATPSTSSFAELTLFVQNESGTSELKTQAQSYVQRYTELSYVRHLAGALQAEAPATNLEAMRVLRLAAERHLPKAQARSLAEQTGADSQQPPRTPNAIAVAAASQVKAKAIDVAAIFRPFVTLLERLQTTYEAPVLKRMAAETLQALNALLPAPITQAATDPLPGTTPKDPSPPTDPSAGSTGGTNGIVSPSPQRR